MVSMSEVKGGLGRNGQKALSLLTKPTASPVSRDHWAVRPSLTYNPSWPLG